MSRFSIRNLYFSIAVCVAPTVIGITSLTQVPVDLFPTIDLPGVIVATFYSGTPPEEIETDITNPLERFSTPASGTDRMKPGSLPGTVRQPHVQRPGRSCGPGP